MYKDNEIDQDSKNGTLVCRFFLIIYIIYLNKKMKEYGNVGYENYNCKGYFGFIISFMLPSILRAQEKRKVIKATIDGVIDGVKSQPVRWKM